MIGDGWTRPAANQFSVSATQKSSSLCVIMACVSVITMLPSIENLRLFWVRYSINVELSQVLSGGDSDVPEYSGGVSSLMSSSKFISVKVGIVLNSGISISFGVLSDSSRSKSVGNGNASDICLLANSGCGIGVATELNADVCRRPTLLRARINA